MGVRFRLLPQFVSRTAQIPGGSQTFWCMSFNKLGLFQWTEYKKIVYLDADMIFLKNVDYLLYYPMFTGSMTQCCDRHENMKPSGGLWIIEPSYNLYDLARVFTNEHDMSHDDGYNTGSSEWKFSDMQVISMMFGKGRKVDSQAARSLVFPESADSRQNIRALLALWSDEREKRVSNWRPLDNDLALAGPWDLTTMPLDVDEEYWYRASTHDRNHFDDIADRLQMPQERGRVWHALNESYDWVAMQCACIPSHDRGHDWFISVHLTCLTFNKPGQFRTLPELRYAVAGNETKIPECMKYYLNMWLDLYEQGMGNLKRTIWWQEEDPETTYKGPWD
ncbi:hypothetical protein SARC_01322 [Sphaeroforma arctica JP610]|uniref:Nucleotide-diphospho-sugar transferase domain-containing protein n=1 Tax=Sphaeroforma arctica JP610 TaxID=667725 RepID=A0A0L0GCB4_9EUKA|nr:hypothetical protein SARC_01322 [Sphaeroforma arctica JP610]KNC86549.1 hypothetical protein SARC_01322 [Sphaeroforma arctica JP610]|eukprot:XP_014160451.1 hypothetical protein SARC_01322 [Sphaeroforma arctica JP610]